MTNNQTGTIRQRKQPVRHYSYSYLDDAKMMMMPSFKKSTMILLLTAVLSCYPASAFTLHHHNHHHHLTSAPLLPHYININNNHNQHQRRPNFQQQPTSASQPAAIESKPTTSSTARAASPSGIDEWSTIAQAGVFFASYIGLGVGTWLGTTTLDNVSKNVIGLESWRNTFIELWIPFILGSFYTLAGVGHFANAAAFQDIYPPNGTWGFWYLPGSAGFHVAWTGVVELAGGVGLLGGVIGRKILPMIIGRDSVEADDDELLLNLIQPTAALVLFMLTVLVTPANIYMFTHGALMGPDMAPLSVQFHFIRFAVQAVFLSLLLTMAKDSFFFAWGDELD